MCSLRALPLPDLAKWPMGALWGIGPTAGGNGWERVFKGEVLGCPGGVKLSPIRIMAEPLRLTRLGPSGTLLSIEKRR
jgi:hypothetical protein